MCSDSYVIPQVLSVLLWPDFSTICIQRWLMFIYFKLNAHSCTVFSALWTCSVLGFKSLYIWLFHINKCHLLTPKNDILSILIHHHVVKNIIMYKMIFGNIRPLIFDFFPGFIMNRMRNLYYSSHTENREHPDAVMRKSDLFFVVVVTN